MRGLGIFLFILFLFSNQASADFRMGLGAGTQNLSYAGVYFPQNYPHSPTVSVGINFIYKTTPAFLFEYENLIRKGWGLNFGILYRSIAALEKTKIETNGTLTEITSSAEDSSLRVIEPRLGVGHGGKWFYWMAGLAAPNTSFNPASTYQGQVRVADGPGRFFALGLSMSDEFCLEFSISLSNLTFRVTDQGTTQRQDFIFSRAALFLTIRL